MSEKPEQRIRWRSHPARDNPVKMGTVLTISVLAAIFAWFIAGPFWAGMAVLVAFLALYSFWLPTTYTLDESGIEVKRFAYRRRFEWSRFRRWEVDKNGIFLGTFKNPSRLDPWRGVYLVAGQKHPEAVEFIKSKIKTS